MLLIGDLHITSRCKDALLTELKNFVDQHTKEKNIIFLGDYVYHFSYDRNALMALYHFFLDLFKVGKNVYILAGNHDRLGNNFVFEEAKKAFEIVGQLKGAMDHAGQIKFITEPMMEDIEGEKILFLPYFIDSQIASLHSQGREQQPSPILGVIQTLSTSQNKNEKLSAIVNQILLSYTSKNEHLTVIHHHYINNTKFPGQKSIFYYKDVALHEAFLDMPQLKLISGHLHQAFSLKNYLCIGSVRSTTSLEVNQMKYLRSYDQGQLIAHEVNINPYILMEDLGPAQLGSGVIDESGLMQSIQKIREENKNNILHSPSRNIKFENEKRLNLNAVSLSLKVESVDYEHIEKFVDEELRMKLKDIKLKKNIQDIEDLRENFETSGKNLSTSFADWKQILKEYLKGKYPNDYQKYEETLHEMKLL